MLFAYIYQLTAVRTRYFPRSEPLDPILPSLGFCTHTHKHKVCPLPRLLSPFRYFTFIQYSVFPPYFVASLSRPHIPYILESNPHPFYAFRGLKNQMRSRIACGLDSRSWAGFWKNDRAAVRSVRTIQYNNLLSYLLFIICNILYNIYNLLFTRLAVITHNWISLPCRQGTVEGKVRIRTAN